MFEGLFQPMHLLVIFFIALLVFGPKKLPELGKGIGEGIRALKDGMKERAEDPAKLPPLRSRPRQRTLPTSPAKLGFRFPVRSSRLLMWLSNRLRPILDSRSDLAPSPIFSQSALTDLELSRLVYVPIQINFARAFCLQLSHIIPRLRNPGGGL